MIPRSGLRTVGAMVAVLGLLLSAVPVHAAASVNWGAPTATPTFGTGIRFEQPVSASDLNALRIELLLVQPGVEGHQARTVAQVGPVTQTTLQYDLLERNSHLFPNTTFTATWRITDVTGQTYIGPPTTITYADTRFDWKTQEGPIIHVHWYRGDEAFGRRALEMGEAGIKKAEDLLGVTEAEPIDFYVYADLPAFYAALGPSVPENVGGLALPETRTLYALITPDQIGQSWVGTVIPHELTHLVFDSATENHFHSPPHWLNEGLAVYLTEGNDAGNRSLVGDAIRDGTIIPLGGLVGDFPGSRDKFGLSYAEAVSAVDFLVRTYGRDALVKLVQSYATGLTDAQAFTGAIGMDDAAFAAAWMADIGARDPTGYGPQPDAPGPLPSGWSSVPEAAAPSAIPSLAASPGAVASGSPGASGPTLPPIDASGPAASPSGGATVPGLSSIPPAASGTPAGSPAPAASPVPGTSAVAGSIAPITSTPPSSAGTTQTRPPNPMLATFLGLLALLLAGGGIALLAFRRQPQPR